MAIDPTTTLGQLRLAVGDVADVPYLPDSVYTQVLQQNNDNVMASVKTVAFYILGLLTSNMRERAGAIEVWGKDAFDNYIEFINMIIKDPRTAMNSAGFYAGGISKRDMLNNKSNPDTNTRPNMHILRPLLPLDRQDDYPNGEYPVWL